MNKELPRTADAKKYKKDCGDFENLDDGTLLGDCRYCKLSGVCRQVSIINGKEVSMEAHELDVCDAVTGELIEKKLFCTGKVDNRELEERREGDEKVLQ